jgi:GNAT superfamily N-acetyltransferase
LRVVDITYEWRGAFANGEVNALHAEAFETRVFDETEWDWERQVLVHSLGWVVAREHADGRLAGFLNVPWDGLVHAWVQDVMVDLRSRRRGVGRRLIEVAVGATRAAGCEWLHVDFDEELRDFYFGACGFRPTTAGLIALRAGADS